MGGSQERIEGRRLVHPTKRMKKDQEGTEEVRNAVDRDRPRRMRRQVEFDGDHPGSEDRRTTPLSVS